MKGEIQIPKMGESILEVTIGAILKPSGSIVKVDEELVEIETEKVNQVLSAPISGKVEWKVKSGDTAKIADVIGTVTPADVVTKEEKLSLPKEKPAKPILEETAPPIRTGRETREKMSKLRKVISQKLVQGKNETAMLTTFNEVDMSEGMRLRKELQESFQKKHGIKLGLMSFFVKATVSALQAFPAVNARIEGDDIVYQHYCDIGIAVGTDKGLFVPVIRDAGTLSYAEIEKKIQEFAEKAKKRTITVDEMAGGTFTISNGGVYGSMLSTPILNPPQSGILGMHNIVKRAVVLNDAIVIRPMMYLALSYDHRIIDGKDSISFLMHLKHDLEHPADEFEN